MRDNLRIVRDITRGLFLIPLVILFTCIAPAQTYWNTVHLANWEHGDIPTSGIPWKYITHLIHFAGSTGGKQTNGTPPYFQVPTGYEDAYGQQLHTLSKQNGVKFLIDLGFNQSGQFCAVERAVGGIAVWAQTVSNYMVQYGYDGADFDLEGGGCYANIANFARALRDSLAIKNPGKKYDLTTSVMMNAYDVTGWHVPEAVAGGWLDQVNGMWYDQCYPQTSPLFKSSTRPCWSNDSAMVFQFVGTGIPKNKIGLGYAIQIYTGCNTCYAIFRQQIGRMLTSTGAVNDSGVQWDNESKERWYSLGTVDVAYEDTLTGYYKADFIKRNGFGGAMGFCLGRGYLPTPPPGWRHNPAAEGIGMWLYGNAPPPPLDTVPPPPSLIQTVDHLRLVTSNNQTAINGYDPLKDGAILSLKRLPTQFTIQAISSPATVGSVSFTVNGLQHTENIFPYSYPNDNGTGIGNCCGTPWSPATGSYTITATPYSGNGLTGTKGTAVSIRVTVLADTSTVLPPPTPQCYSLKQIDSAFQAGVKSVLACPPFPDTAGMKALSHAQGMVDYKALIPDSSEVVVQPPTIRLRVANPKP